MQKSLENDKIQIDQAKNQQSPVVESNVIMKINRFSEQLDFQYSSYPSQNPKQNNAIIPFDPLQQQDTNQQLQLLSDTNQDSKLEFFRSTLYIWLFWQSTMFIILIFNVTQIDYYCYQIKGLIQYGCLYLGLFALILIKYANEKKLVFLDNINNNNVDKLLFVLVIIIEGIFHVKFIAIIECLCVGNKNYGGDFDFELERQIIYVSILIHLSILISIGIMLVVTLIQQKIDPKQYFIISFVISLIMGIMYQAASLKIEIIPILIIIVIFCLFGTATVLSGQQIANGKFALNHKRKYMGALLQYLNLFLLCF
ncbi:unnamed protein product [Paramecium primaurelia]|uniref:Transmembrane protein n=1 Tax=Paramecium primaurelia TaxID=5886 RepID=A0A8S1MI51_PARPR|nr:unnamed protein product [Paramecium primaurelia]